MTDALARVRSDLTEYYEIRSVYRDAIECHAPLDQETELLRQCNDVADRICGATIAGIPPTGGWGEEILQSERFVLDADPRPGSWFGDEGADGRMLTQGQTDILVRAELWMSTALEPVGEALRALVGDPKWPVLDFPPNQGRLDGSQVLARHQRGGIDSDPLVRLLAFRTWGERDRRWFEDHGVRAGEPVTMIDAETVVRAWNVHQEIGEALEEGRPGQRIKVRMTPGRGVVWFRVGERPRQAPAWAGATSDEILADIRSLIADPRECADAELRYVGPMRFVERNYAAQYNQAPVPVARPSTPPVPRWARQRGKR